MSFEQEVLTRLTHIEQRIKQMQLDLTKIMASEAAAKAAIEHALTIISTTTAKVTELSTQLATAVAQNDPAAQKAVQDQLDALAADLDSETAKLVSAEHPSGASGGSEPPAPAASGASG